MKEASPDPGWAWARRRGRRSLCDEALRAVGELVNDPHLSEGAKRVRQDIVEGCLLAQEARIRELETEPPVRLDEAATGNDRKH